MRLIAYSKVGVFAAFIATALSSGCDVYEGKYDEDIEFNAGGADPYNYPPPYRGNGCFSTTCVRQTAASGVFTEVAGFAKGTPIGYYQFPFSPSQLQTTNYSAPLASSWPEGAIDPLRISGPGTDFRVSANNPVPVPSVYNFDPPGNDVPFPETSKCTAPPNYKIVPFAEGVPANEQWNVFTFTPDKYTTYGFGTLPTWNYRPIVAEVPVVTTSLDCQAVKSERTLLKRADEGALQVPRGEPEADKRLGRLGLPTPDRYLAWAIINPGAAVVRVGERPDVLQGGTVSGTSVQRYGWYGQFIIQYIDGGYIPVEDGPRVAGAPTKKMRTMRIYYPRSLVVRNGSTSETPGALGQGYDVVQADRFKNPEEYSPVCEVWTYSLPAAFKQADLPKSEADILALANSSLEPARTTQTAGAFTPSPTVTPRYIFCLQAAPRAVQP